MRFTIRDQSPAEAHTHCQEQWAGRLRAWVRSPVFGYVASILLVGSLLVLEKIDEYLPQAPLFTGTPFALISILTAHSSGESDQHCFHWY